MTARRGTLIDHGSHGEDNNRVAGGGMNAGRAMEPDLMGRDEPRVDARPWTDDREGRGSGYIASPSSNQHPRSRRGSAPGSAARSADRRVAGPDNGGIRTDDG